MIGVQPRPEPLWEAISHRLLLDPDDAPAASAPPKVARKPAGTTFANWILGVLSREGGVLSATPRGSWRDGADATVSRIVRLDHTRAAGQADWWLAQAQQSHFALSHVCGDSNVYVTDGLEKVENAWLPEARDVDHGIDEDAFELATLPGFAVTVHAAPDEEGDAVGTVFSQRCLLELESAANGVAPALLALCFAHYASARKGVAAKLANAPMESTPRQSDHVHACVLVSQAHSFRFADMLKAFNEVCNDPLRRPSLAAAESTLFEASAAIARKLRATANGRVLKMNVTPETIVFCPSLVEGEAGDLVAQGYGLDGTAAARGVPHLVDFDPLYTKRFAASNGDYCADAAYSTMALSLLAHTRATHGERAARVVLNKLSGRSATGCALPEAELPERFEDISLAKSTLKARQHVVLFAVALKSLLPAYAKKETALADAYAEAAKNLSEIVNGDALGLAASAPFDPSRPVFCKLVLHTTGSSAADTAVFAPPAADAELDGERSLLIERRLAAVREARAVRSNA